MTRGILRAWGLKLAGVGAVWRSFLDRFTDTVSVRDYGALGDGVADDAPAFVAAAAAAAYVRVPAGTYKLNSNVLTGTFVYEGAVFTGVGTLPDSIALGKGALASATTGTKNTAVGYEALTSNDVGEQNTALGYRALYKAVRYLNPFYPVPDALNEYLNSSGNVAVGYKAGYALKGANYNVAIGFEALGGPENAAQGAGNIAIGDSAMHVNVTGEQNVAIGGSAVLGAGTSAANNVAIGWGAMQGTTTGGDNVAIGIYAQKTATGQFRCVAIGDESLFSLTTGADNTAVGSNAGHAITTGAGNVALGRKAGYALADGNYNIAVGFGALGAAAGTCGGSNNIAIGASALQAATSADRNTACGDAALTANTSADDNVAIGYQAGQALTVNGENTVVGSSAGTLVTGSGNTIVGKGAAAHLTTGSYNTVIGLGAGTEAAVFDLTTESGRVILGDSGVSNVYCKVALTVTSDARDKTDVQPFPYGLSFVNALRPVMFRWDDRSRYWELVKDENGNVASYIKHDSDGSKADEFYSGGFLAQDVIANEKAHGATKCLIGDEEHADALKITETKTIPALVIAIQELSQQLTELRAECDAYKTAHP